MDDPNYKDFVKYLDELVENKGKRNYFIDPDVKDAILAKLAKGGIEKNFINKQIFVFNLNQLVLNTNYEKYPVGKKHINQFITIFKYCNDSNKNDRNKNIFKDIEMNKDKTEFIFKQTSASAPAPATPAPAPAPAPASATPRPIDTETLTVIQTMTDDYIFYNANQKIQYNKSINTFKSKIKNKDNKESFQQYLDHLGGCNSFPLLVYYIEHYILNYWDDEMYEMYDKYNKQQPFINVCKILNIFSQQEKDSVQYNKFNIEMKTISLSDVKKSIIPEIENYIKHNTKVKTGGKFKIKNYKNNKNSYKNKKSKKSKTNKKTNKSKNSYKNKKSKKSKIN